MTDENPSPPTSSSRSGSVAGEQARDFSDVGKLLDVQFEDCDLRYASFVKLRLRATTFRGCAARKANFLEMDLTEADFSDSDLKGSTIEGCLLAKTDFRRATGVFFDPQRNRNLGEGRPHRRGSLVQSLGIVVEG